MVRRAHQQRIDVFDARDLPGIALDYVDELAGASRALALVPASGARRWMSLRILASATAA